MALEVITYNNVPLQIIATKEISRRHVMSDDNTTYLWTEWVFDVVTQLNRHTIGFLLNQVVPGGFGGPGPSELNTPAIIDPVIRKLLNVPRRPLVFSQSPDGNTWNVVLNVPNNPANLTASQIPAGQTDPNAGNIGGTGTGQVTDANLGPFVEDFNLVRDHSGNTWIVKIRLVARVRECVFSPGNSNPPVTNPIISHRWTRRIDTDQQHLSYCETSGEVIFDSAWLKALGTFPDQYRVDLFQPIAPNCSRENIVVEQASDGVTFHYSYRDQERHFNSLPAVKIEAWKTYGFSQQGFETALAAQAVQGVPQLITDAIDVFKSAAANPAPWVPLDVAAGVTGVALGNIARNSFQTFVRQIPKFSVHILVKAWGNRQTPKWALLAQALGIAVSHFSTLRNAEMIITYELSGKYVELQMTNTTGPEQLFRLGAQQTSNVANAVKKFVTDGLQGNVNLSTIFGTGQVPSINRNQQLGIDIMMNTPENDPAGWYDQDENVTRQAFVDRRAEDATWAAAFPDGPTSGDNQYYGNMQPPNSNYTRGTLICNLISQSLHNPCTPPPCPPPVYDANGEPIEFPDVRTCSRTAGAPQSDEDADTPETGGNLGVNLNTFVGTDNIPPLQNIISPNG